VDTDQFAKSDGNVHLVIKSVKVVRPGTQWTRKQALKLNDGQRDRRHFDGSPATGLLWI
jgi:hypothetical protein